MASSTILRRITSASFQLLKTNFRSVQSCNICASPLSKSWFSKKKKVPVGPMVVRPNSCAEPAVPILEPTCKAAIVIGGKGSGFEAANYLLCKGAHGVVVLDDDSCVGEAAAKKLCDSYGRGRAHFVFCDIKETCQFEAAFNFAFHTYKNIRIIFNDLDKKRYPKSESPSDINQNQNLDNIAPNIMEIGLKMISKENGGPGGIIVSSASLLGFIDFPEDPFPIYCLKEAAIETTMHFAKMRDAQKTGVRLVTLCPVNKPFSQIALPCLPNLTHNCKLNNRPPCIPSPNAKIGSALGYVMAWAKNGSTWIVEPATCPGEYPREIFFPLKKDGKVDPKLYDTEHKLRSSYMEKDKRRSYETTVGKKK